MDSLEPSDAGRRVVCFGEALVDLVCEQPVDSLAEAPAFVPRVGGSLANIAVVASRFGAGTELCGGIGDDEFGRWLREQIGALGVDVERFAPVPGVATTVALVAVSPAAEPSFAFYGGVRRPAAFAGPQLGTALSDPPGVLVLGSDTLIGDAERAVTLRAAALARERGWTVLCDPNLRPARWAGDAEMLASSRALVAAADVVKCNAAEARALTGEDEDESAARALRALGPRVVAVTRGPEGALLVRGDGGIAVPAVDVGAAVDATGAGDCVAGILAAAIAAGLDAEDLDRALPVAMDGAAGVMSEWGALTGLPAPARARAALEAIL